MKSTIKTIKFLIKFYISKFINSNAKRRLSIYFIYISANFKFNKYTVPCHPKVNTSKIKNEESELKFD